MINTPAAVGGKKMGDETRAQKKKRREENRQIQENLFWVTYQQP